MVEKEKDVNGDEIARESLKEFSRKATYLPTSVLERLIADLSTDIDFLNEQIAVEPELYETDAGKKTKDRNLKIAKKKLQIVETEFRKRPHISRSE
jgi:hypothetical protein